MALPTKGTGTGLETQIWRLSKKTNKYVAAAELQDRAEDLQVSMFRGAGSWDLLDRIVVHLTRFVSARASIFSRKKSWVASLPLWGCLSSEPLHLQWYARTIPSGTSITRPLAGFLAPLPTFLPFGAG